MKQYEVVTKILHCLTFQVICYFHLQSQLLASSTILVTCTIKLDFPSSTTNFPNLYLNLHLFHPLILLSYILSTSKTCLQTWNLYSTMGRRKSTSNVTLNTLESMHYYILCLFAKGKTKNRKGLWSKNNLPYLWCDTHRTLWFTNHC